MTKGKMEKENWGNNSYLISFELFLVLCQPRWTTVEKKDKKCE